MDELLIVALTLAGTVFAVSSAGKLSGRLAYRTFRDQLAETGLVPESIVPATGVSLAGTEVAAAAGLLTGDALTVVAVPGTQWLAESALTVTAALTAVLALGVATIIRRGATARCACFGARSGRPLGRPHLARNLSLLAVVCAGLVAAPFVHGRLMPAGAALAALTGAVAAMFFVRWDDIAELFAPTSATARQPAPRKG
jgi:hypothetical protein